MGRLSSSVRGPLHGLLECPHDMVAGLPGAGDPGDPGRSLGALFELTPEVRLRHFHHTPLPHRLALIHGGWRLRRGVKDQEVRITGTVLEAGHRTKPAQESTGWRNKLSL